MGHTEIVHALARVTTTLNRVAAITCVGRARLIEDGFARQDDGEGFDFPVSRLLTGIAALPDVLVREIVEFIGVTGEE